MKLLLCVVVVSSRVRSVVACFVRFVLFLLGVAQWALDRWFFDHPIEHIVVLKAHAVEEILEQLAEVPYVRLLVEFKRPAVTQVVADFFWKVLA